MTAERGSTDAKTLPAPYWRRSKRPLEMLVFLLPFVVVYEIGIALFFSSDAGGTGILAYVLLEKLFVSLGLGGAGMALPGVLVVVALLVQHVLSRASWTLHPPTLVAMAVESLVLTLPLLIFGAAIMTATPLASVAGPEPVPAPGPEAGLAPRLVLAVGAGLYEELVFRWALIGLIHVVVADLMKVASTRATWLAVLLSSVVFMAAHFLGRPFDPRAAIFFLVAGAYFGATFVTRGFGIAAGTHAFYDVLVELLTEAPPPA